MRARATKYSKECGCGTSAAFVGGALVLAFIYVATLGHFHTAALAPSFLFVLGAGLVGKVLGLSYGAIRLALLRRSLRQIVTSVVP